MCNVLKSRHNASAPIKWDKQLLNFMCTLWVKQKKAAGGKDPDPVLYMRMFLCRPGQRPCSQARTSWENAAGTLRMCWHHRVKSGVQIYITAHIRSEYAASYMECVGPRKHYKVKSGVQIYIAAHIESECTAFYVRVLLCVPRVHCLVYAFVVMCNVIIPGQRSLRTLQIHSLRQSVLPHWLLTLPGERYRNSAQVSEPESQIWRTNINCTCRIRVHYVFYACGLMCAVYI